MSDPFQTLQSRLPDGTTATLHRGIVTVTGFRGAVLLKLDTSGKRAWVDADPEFMDILVKTVTRKMEQDNGGLYRKELH